MNLVNQNATGRWYATGVNINHSEPYDTVVEVSLECPGIGPVSSTDLVKDIERKLNNDTPYHHFYGSPRIPSIKDVIHNPPATIILWADKTKTVVKTQNGEPYDPEKGFAMAVTKKVYGNKGNYFNTVKKWTEGYEDAKNGAAIYASFKPKSFATAALNELKNVLGC